MKTATDIKEKIKHFGSRIVNKDRSSSSTKCSLDAPKGPRHSAAIPNDSHAPPAVQGTRGSGAPSPSLGTQLLDSGSSEDRASDASYESRSDRSSAPGRVAQVKPFDATNSALREQGPDVIHDSDTSGIRKAPSKPSNVVQRVDPVLTEKSARTRILIVGRENAGKSTILQRICDSTESPEIYNEQGEKINIAIEGSGEHRFRDINYGMVFKSNPGFVFHSSPGFGVGHEDEFEKMKNFIRERTSKTIPEQRIHAIWYCIPMDQFHRAISVAEERFFGECDTVGKNVLVVVVFTKFDTLVTQSFRPEDLQLPPKDQVQVQVERTEEIFIKRDIWGDLQKMAFPPQQFVQLQEMNISNQGCSILLEKTTAALIDEKFQ